MAASFLRRIKYAVLDYLGVVSPSRALFNCVNGTASKREREAVESILKDYREFLDAKPGRREALRQWMDPTY